MQEIQTVYRTVACNVFPPLIQNAITRIRGETAKQRSRETKQLSATSPTHTHTLTEQNLFRRKHGQCNAAMRRMQANR